MPKHRVDIGIKGTSHYVDGQLHGTSGFPLRGKLPAGLHLERRVDRAPTNKKFVRRPGVGMSVEWTSNRNGRRAQEDQHQAERPPGSRRGSRQGSRRGGDPDEGPGQDPGQDLGQEPNRSPGLFDVSERNSEDETEDEDVHSRVPHDNSVHSRRSDFGFAEYQHHHGYRRGYDGPSRTTRATSFFPPEPNMVEQWESVHRVAGYHRHYGHSGGYDGPGRATRAMSFDHLESDWGEQWEYDDGIPTYEDDYAIRRGYECPGHATRAMGFVPSESYGSERPPRFEDRRRRHGHRHHRSRR